MKKIRMAALITLYRHGPSPLIETSSGIVGRSYHFNVTESYHDFGNSGCSSLLPLTLADVTGISPSAVATDDIKRHGCQTCEAQRTGCRRRHVNDPTSHEWTAVVNSDDYRAATTLMSDAHQRSKRKSFVSGCHAVGIGFIAICGLASGIN